MLPDKPDTLASVPELRREQSSRQHRHNAGQTSVVSDFCSTVQRS
jgi:hypothetical protein